MQGVDEPLQRAENIGRNLIGGQDANLHRQHQGAKNRGKGHLAEAVVEIDDGKSPQHGDHDFADGDAEAMMNEFVS
jgi:hypothetical protein